MNKNSLKQLRGLKNERDDLERRIKQFKPKEFVGDTAKDYRTGYPKTIQLQGYGDNDWVKLCDRYKTKIGQLTRQIEMLENFLDNVEDAEMHNILRMRYVDGLTQEQIADRLNYSRDAINKKEDRFWKCTQKSQNNSLE